MRALSLALVCLAARAAADPMPMSAGASPAPASSDTIGLAKEDLTIDVAGDTAAVRALLTLENRGAAARLDVGFPCDTGAEPGMEGLDCKTAVAVRIDGALRTARREHGRVTWHLTDVEPGEDLAILTHPMYLDRYAGAVKARSRAELVDALTRNRADRAALEHVAGQMRSGIDEIVRYAQCQSLNRQDAKNAKSGPICSFRILAYLASWRFSLSDRPWRYAAFFQDVARAKLGLPEPRPDDVRACVEASAALMLSTP